jgi:hypothetical protein
MSEPLGCCIAALLVSILISVTAIIAKTTWEQIFLSFKSAEMSRNLRILSEVHVIATSRIHYSNDLVMYKNAVEVIMALNEATDRVKNAG